MVTMKDACHSRLNLLKTNWFTFTWDRVQYEFTFIAVVILKLDSGDQTYVLFITFIILKHVRFSDSFDCLTSSFCPSVCTYGSSLLLLFP